jgi:hypothetical protein
LPFAIGHYLSERDDGVLFALPRLDRDHELERPGRDVAFHHGEEGADALNRSPATGRKLVDAEGGIEAVDEELETSLRLAFAVAGVLPEVGAVLEATGDLLAATAEGETGPKLIVLVYEILEP